MQVAWTERELEKKEKHNAGGGPSDFDTIHENTTKVYLAGGLLRRCTRPTLNRLLLLRILRASASAGVLRTSTRPTLNLLLLLLRASV